MVKSVFRAVKILELLSDRHQLNVTEISRELALPKSTAHEILATLERENILAKDRNNRYHLGIKLFELGSLAQPDLELRRLANPFLQELNVTFDETVHLSILDRDEVLYVDTLESTKGLRPHAILGVRAPLFCTGVGKAILAFLGHDEIDRYFAEHELQGKTEQTITDEPRLRDDLHTTLERGYSIDNMESEEWLRCIGAPIRNRSGKVFASISLSGPSQRVTQEKIPEIGKEVMRQADNISKRLGFYVE